MRATLLALLRSPPRGVAAVEFGLAAPFLILLIVALVDFGLGFYDYLQVRGAVAAGAQYASLHGFTTADTGNAGPIVNAVKTNANAAGLTFAANGIGAFQRCACPTSSGQLLNEQNPPAGTGLCSAVSCNGFGCTVSATHTCPAGLYAKVTANFSYSPILPYPWAKTPLTLTAQTYHRLQ